MSVVWERSAHSGSHLLMLLAIADFADDDGRAYPAVATLATKCRMQPRNAQVILAALRQSGELEVRESEGPRGTNLYRITLVQGVQTAAGAQGIAGVQEPAGVQRLAPRGAKACAKPLQRLAPEPSMNHQDPPKGRAARRPEQVEVPDWIPPDAWTDFCEMRKLIRKPLTPAAMRLQIKALDELRGKGHDPRAVLEQSTAASWQGLFPIKQQMGQTAQPSRQPVLHADDDLRLEGAFD